MNFRTPFAVVVVGAFFLSACIGDDDGDMSNEALSDEGDEIASVSQELPYSLGSTLGSPVTTSNTCGAYNEYSPSCAYSNASDHSYYWSAPYTGNFTFTTTGSTFDTILLIRDNSNTTTLGCNDDANGTVQSSVNVSLQAGQQVIIVVDGYSTACGNFMLNISGTPQPPACTWTQWFNRDAPSGTGDWETRADLPVCATPAAIECKTISGVNWTQTGEVMHVAPSDGCICMNSEQPDGYCMDYTVRFCCP